MLKSPLPFHAVKDPLGARETCIQQFPSNPKEPFSRYTLAKIKIPIKPRLNLGTSWTSGWNVRTSWLCYSCFPSNRPYKLVSWNFLPPPPFHFSLSRGSFVTFPSFFSCYFLLGPFLLFTATFHESSIGQWHDSRAFSRNTQDPMLFVTGPVPTSCFPGFDIHIACFSKLRYSCLLSLVQATNDKRILLKLESFEYRTCGEG